MRRLNLGITFSFIFLTSCFLNQSEPKGSGIKSVQGVVTLEDSKAGSTVEAAVSAMFVRKAPGKQMVGRAARMATFGASLGTSDDEKKKPHCEAKSGKPVNPQDGGGGNGQNALKAKRVSVGRLLFGPQGVELDQDDRLQYKKRVETELPAGIYPVVAEGSEEGASFTGEISMPELLADVKINGTFVTEPATIIHKKDALTMSWKPAGTGADQTLILLDVIAQDEEKAAVIRCIGVEGDLVTKDGATQWALESGLMSEFPDDVTARIYLLRAQVKGLHSASADVQFQGMRTSYSMAEVHQ